MKKVFITGATSMIGIALIDECIKNQVKATILVRENSPNNHRLPQSEYIEYFYGDLEYLSDLVIDNDYDAFYHFAWLGTDKTQRNLAEIQFKNIQITLNCIHFAKKINCKKFIGAGSQAEYGKIDGIITPETNVNPDIAYGIAKYTAGRLGNILAQELGIEFIWGRIFSVYGKYDNTHTMISQCIKSIKEKTIFHLTPCEQLWNYLYSEDIGLAFFLLGKSTKAQGIYNIAHTDSMPLKNYIQTIIEITKGQEFLKIGALEYQKNQVMNLNPDISKLQQDIGFIPKYSFEEGLYRTICSFDINSD